MGDDELPERSLEAREARTEGIDILVLAGFVALAIFVIGLIDEDGAGIGRLPLPGRGVDSKRAIARQASFPVGQRRIGQDTRPGSSACSFRLEKLVLIPHLARTLGRFCELAA